MADPIEVTTRYATTVDDLSQAWSFVMDWIERVGPDPSIEIRCVRRHMVGVAAMLEDDRPDDWQRAFEVVVSGTIQTATAPPAGGAGPATKESKDG